jgi:hypothetical protein
MSIINDIIIQAEHAKEYEVQVELPESFAFYGEVPYDIHIYGKTAFITVPADSLEIAVKLANEYIQGGVDQE